MQKKPVTLKDWEAGIGVLENNITDQPVNTPLIERRRAPRVSMTVPVYYQIKENTRQWETTETVDVSKYGIRLSSVSGNIKIGSRLNLEVKLPDMPELFHLDGVVVWVKPKADTSSKIVECGISFENPKKINHLNKVLYFLTDKLCQYALKHAESLEAYPVQSVEDLKTAYRLVYSEYRKRDYCGEDPSEMYYTSFCVLPETQTFLMREKGRLLGTITVVPDSPCGIPMESVFPDEVARLRCPHRKMAEVSLLALDLKHFEKRSFTLTDFEKMSASFKLFKTMFDFARTACGVTDLMIAMHPKHQGLYQYLGFETLGFVKSYTIGRSQPALPMHLDMERAVKEVNPDRGTGSYFLKPSTNTETWASRYRWTKEDVAYFLTKIRNLWSHIPAKHRSHLSACYPGLVIKDCTGQ